MINKKKILLVFLLIAITSSVLLAYDLVFPGDHFTAFRLGDRIGVWVVSLIILLLYVSNSKTHQLVPSVLSMEKDTGKGKEKSDVSFKNVAGLDEIKEELHETIDFINHSLKYKQMGAKIPKGILFHGPPGTGKTLLAKAVAGETNSNFLYASGSEFVEKYVGVGAKRVRTLFEKAKRDA